MPFRSQIHLFNFFLTLLNYVRPKPTLEEHKMRTMKFCTNCGVKISDEVDYCSNCGYRHLKVEDNPYRVSLANTSKKVDTLKQVTSNTREKTLNVIGGIILVTGFISLAFLYLFFQEWLAILWPYIVGIVAFSWIIRLIIAGIEEITKRRKKNPIKSLSYNLRNKQEE